ncbi:hypothetical protein [Delftia sp. WSY_7]|uniref:hypothetical protein n=1 Tax=Delftia sp. WSY_7 TaxID=3367202 RepID=UPI003709D1CD
MDKKKLIQIKHKIEEHDYYNLFSQIDTRAHFDYQTYTLHLDKVSKKDGEAAANYLLTEPASEISNKDYFDIEDALSLFVHEYTHFIDFSSTIFGLEHLSKLAAAAACQKSEFIDETDFYPAKKYSDYLRTLRPSKYYDQKGDLGIPREKWGAFASSGVVFNSSGKPSTKPIIFIRFMTPERRHIARAPVSAIAILEASATAQELLAGIELIQRSEDPEIKLIDLTNKNLSFLYNAELTDYSVCSHLVANQLRCKDIHLVARIVATLTRIVLNTPPSVFDDINRSIERTPYFFTMGDGAEEKQLKKRMRNAMKFRDIGALFLLLTRCMPKAPESGEQFKIFISTTLATAGYKKDWGKKSQEHANQLMRIIESLDVPHLTKIAFCGYNNFTTLMNSGYKIKFASLHIPSCYIENNTDILTPFKNKTNELSEINIKELYEIGVYTESWINKVASACINL